MDQQGENSLGKDQLPPLQQPPTKLERLLQKSSQWKTETFTVVPIDLEIYGIGTAASKPLVEGTVHKRARLDDAVNDLHQIYYFNNPALSSEQDQDQFSRTRRCRSEDPALQVCAEQRRLQLLEHTARPGTKPDAANMSGKSPGHRNHQLGKAITTTSRRLNPGTSNFGSSSPTLADGVRNRNEFAESSRDNDDGTPPVVESARSLKSKTKIVQKESPILLPLKESAASGSGHAPLQTDVKQENNAVEESRPRWEFYARYLDITKPCVPFYNPKPNGIGTPLPPRQVNGNMVNLQGFGPKPANSLGDKQKPKPNSTQPYISHLPATRSSHDTREDLSPPPPSKRQKTDATSKIGSGLVIDLDPEATRQVARPSGHSTARSSQSHTQTSRPKSMLGDTAELHASEEHIKPGKRSKPRHESRFDYSKYSNPPQASQPAKKRTAVRLPELPREDVTDPIEFTDSSDQDELQIEEPLQAPQHRNPSVQVLITSSLRENDSTTSKAIAKSGQPQLKPNGHRKLPMKGPDTTETPHSRVSRHKNKTIEIEDDPSPPIFQKSKWQAASKSQVSTGTRATKLNDHNGVDADSEDDLVKDFSKDETGNKEKEREDREQANHLIEAQKKAQARKQISQSNKKSSHQSSISLNSSTDDEDTLKEADLTRTNFTKSKKKALERPVFKIVQIISPADQWLISESRATWTAQLSPTFEKVLIKNNEERLIPDLELVLSSMRLTESNPKSPIFILTKSKDQTANEAFKLVFELADATQCHQFVLELSENTKGLTCVKYPLDQLQRTLDNFKKLASKSTRNRKPEDIELLEVKERAKLKRQQVTRQQEINKVGSKIKDRLQIENGDTQQIRDPSSRPIRIRPNPNHGRDDDSSKYFKKNQEIAPKHFYGTRGSSNIAPLESLDSSPAHDTRSSARAIERSQRARPQPRPRTPSPERWTDGHPKWENLWKNSIVYPPKGKNKATVDKGDIPRLDEGEFLNDNLIVFYLRWLEHHLSQEHPELAKRIYFKNTFFYERLTNTKGRRGINYEAVERWTAKVNLLEYDYIIVPVNENAHWYVAIICNAPKLLNPEPDCEIVESSANAPGSELRPPVKDNLPEPATSSPRSLSPQKDVGVEKGVAALSLDGRSAEAAAKEGTRDDIPANSILYEDSNVSEEVKHTSGEPYTMKETGEAQDEAGINERESTLPLVTSNLPRIDGAGDELGENPPFSKPGKPELAPNTTSRASSYAKKGRRKSGPGSRKYDPSAPRIITFDSLGGTHSPTCSNLKNYLLQEIKSKLNVEVADPGALGTNATGIPGQTNFCDCGLFLLGYIETFLKNPDEFIHNILQREHDEDIIWPKAPDMRNKIREILFGLQEPSQADAYKELLQEQVSKRETRMREEAARAVKSNSTSKGVASRGATKSIRHSATPPQAATTEPSKGAKAEIDKSRSSLDPISHPSKRTGKAVLDNKLAQSPAALESRSGGDANSLGAVDSSGSKPAETHVEDSPHQETAKWHLTRSFSGVAQIFKGLIHGSEAPKVPVKKRGQEVISIEGSQISENSGNASSQNGLLTADTPHPVQSHVPFNFEARQWDEEHAWFIENPSERAEMRNLVPPSMSLKREIPASDEEARNGQHDWTPNSRPKNYDFRMERYHTREPSPNVNGTPIVDLSGGDEDEVDLVGMGNSKSPSEENHGNEDDEMLLGSEPSSDTSRSRLKPSDPIPPTSLATSPLQDHRQGYQSGPPRIGIRGGDSKFSQNVTPKRKAGVFDIEGKDEVQFQRAQLVGHRSRSSNAAEIQDDAAFRPNNFKKHKTEPDNLEAFRFPKTSETQSAGPRGYQRDPLDQVMIQSVKKPKHTKFEK